MPRKCLDLHRRRQNLFASISTIESSIRAHRRSMSLSPRLLQARYRLRRHAGATDVAPFTLTWAVKITTSCGKEVELVRDGGQLVTSRLIIQTVEHFNTVQSGAQQLR